MPDGSDHVLIVDDEPVNRMMLADFLGDLGYSNSSASDGLTAIKRIADDPPDLVLLDIDMPKVDGYGVLKAVKADPHLRSIPVLMISGLDDLESIVRCIELGAEGFLPKPLNPTLLRARIKAALEKKHFRDREQALLQNLEASYQALHRAERDRDAMAQMIVHDLNTPLSVIQMNAELLALKLSVGKIAESDLREGLEKVSDASETLSRLLQGILDVSRFEEGQMAVTLSFVDLNEVVGDVGSSFSRQADERGLRLEVDRFPGGAMVFADEQLTRRMVQNLVSNALKYAASGSYVRARVAMEAGIATIEVEDDGPGIPAESLERVFDKYFQARPEGGARHFGVGLGLAFCKLAAEAQGAAIKVASQAGEGTRFTIQFGR